MSSRSPCFASTLSTNLKCPNVLGTDIPRTGVIGTNHSGISEHRWRRYSYALLITIDQASEPTCSSTPSLYSLPMSANPDFEGSKRFVYAEDADVSTVCISRWLLRTPAAIAPIFRRYASRSIHAADFGPTWYVSNLKEHLKVFNRIPIQSIAKRRSRSSVTFLSLQPEQVQESDCA